MAPRWFFRAGSWGGAAIVWHGLLPVAAVLLSGWGFHPVRWLAVVALLLFHALGHAWWARRFGVTVRTIRVLPVGGDCDWEGAVTERQRSIIAVGGLLAQALAGLAATVALWLSPPLARAWGADVAHAWTTANAWLMVINLLPVAPLDGHEAWRRLRDWAQTQAQRVETERVRRRAEALRRARAAALREAVRVDSVATDDGRPADAPTGPSPAADPPVDEAARALAAAMWKQATRREVE